MNRVKTGMFLAALTALLLWLGLMFGGQAGLLVAAIVACSMNFGAYWFSDRIVLRMYRAAEVTESQAPDLFAAVRELANRGRLPMPRVYIIPEEAPNAFATGRNPQHAAVAVTAGLMRLLNRDELAGVIGHELAHVKNRDTLIMAIAASIAGALSLLANIAAWGFRFGSSDDDDDNPLAGIIGIIVAPLAAALIQMAISRSREYYADEVGAQLTGNPLALANALRKIEGGSHQIPLGSGSPATAHLFIINPFSGGGVAGLFSTHPATRARIERLEAIARQGMPVGSIG